MGSYPPQRTFFEGIILFTNLITMYTVYVLYSEKFDKHYTGFTSDLDARFQSHNELGKNDWTGRYRPWKIIHTETYDSKPEAMKREKWLKTGAGRDFIKNLHRI